MFGRKSNTEVKPKYKVTVYHLGMDPIEYEALGYNFWNYSTDIKLIDGRHMRFSKAVPVVIEDV